MSEQKSWLKNVDHITFACKPESIKRWAWYHIEVEGGKIIQKIDDVRPDDPDSSMMLWCIDYGTFGVALVAGIDRKKQSQVTAFVNKHGDHAIQHPAFNLDNIEKFREHVKQFNAKFRGDMMVGRDAFGVYKQIFGKGYDVTADPAEAVFPEYVERPKVEKGEAGITFSNRAGKGFYQQIEDAREEGDEEVLVDFSVMPDDWEPIVEE